MGNGFDRFPVPTLGRLDAVGFFNLYRNSRPRTCASLCLDEGSSSTIRPSASSFPSGRGTLRKASMSPIAGTYSGMNGFSFVSRMISCG